MINILIKTRESNIALELASTSDNSDAADGKERHGGGFGDEGDAIYDVI